MHETEEHRKAIS